MKNRFIITTAVVLAVGFFTLASFAPAAEAAAKKGKVAIVTNTVSQNEEEYRSAQEMVKKYGDRIVHVTWPDNFMAEQEQTQSALDTAMERWMYLQERYEEIQAAKEGKA